MTRSNKILILLTLVLALGGVGLVGPALSGEAEEPSPEPRSREVLFMDDFDGSTLSPSRWRTCHWWSDGGCTIATNDELEWYQPRQVQVGDGNAELIAARRKVVGSDGRKYRFASGMISTGPGPEDGPRFAFTYGRATIRARVPSGPGLWPAFWMLPTTRRSEPEIDVMEMTSDEPNTVQMHLHYRAGGKERSLGRDWGPLSPGWHRFSIDWRPGKLVWLVDGRRRWSVSGAKVPSQPMYLIANLAVDGDPSPTRATKFPAKYLIDWVRVTR